MKKPTLNIDQTNFVLEVLGKHLNISIDQIKIIRTELLGAKPQPEIKIVYEGPYQKPQTFTITENNTTGDNF